MIEFSLVVTEIRLKLILFDSSNWKCARLNG